MSNYNGTTNLLESMQSLDVSPQFDGYTKVVVSVSDDVAYTAGDDTGRTMEISCPWGTQQIANDILANIKGYQYQPYTATGGLLDPAAELGDGIYVSGTYGGIYKQSDTFGRAYKADVSAPTDEEVDHEYPYETQENRTITRNLKNLTTELKVQEGLISAEVAEREALGNEIDAKLAVQAGLISAEVAERKALGDEIDAKLTVQSGEISAKVSKTGGSASSFGWTLNDNSWTLTANGSTVLTATKDGLSISGVITATVGKIGGFTINSNYLSFNNKTWDNGISQGAYIGTLGIKIGNNFSVDMYGNLTAATGTFTGSVYAGNIQYGSSAGYVSGGALSSGSVYGDKLVGNTVTTAYTSSGINTSLGYADSAYSMLNGWALINKITSKYVYVNNDCACGSLAIGGTTVKKLSKTVKNSSGKNETIYYWGWG